QRTPAPADARPAAAGPGVAPAGGRAPLRVARRARPGPTRAPGLRHPPPAAGRVTGDVSRRAEAPGRGAATDVGPGPATDAGHVTGPKHDDTSVKPSRHQRGNSACAC